MIDSNFNVLDQKGNILFTKDCLDADGDIPKVYRCGLLKSTSESSLSRLMSDIEKQHYSDMDNPKMAKEYDTEEYGTQDEMDNILNNAET